MFSDPPLALRYDPSVEHAEPDEDKVREEMIETMRKITDATFKHEGRALRSVHAKAHGVVVGELEVMADLPPVLAQGLFAKAATYPVVMRFSTLPGDVLDDSVSTPRGLAIKVIGVEGERLPGSEGDVTQDFVMGNGPAFGAPTAKAFLANLKLLAATTDKIEGVKKVMSSAMQGVQKLTVAATGKPNPMVATLGGQPETHVLGDTYFSQAPLLYGEYIAKIAIAPMSPSLSALKDKPVEVSGKPDALREAVTEFFAATPATWEVQVQLCTDLDAMPVENAAKIWPEDQSPYITVARITTQPQSSWNEGRAKAVDEGYSFSPWHGLAAHRPLGSVNRVRQKTYQKDVSVRAEHSGRSIVEPHSVDFT